MAPIDGEATSRIAAAVGSTPLRLAAAWKCGRARAWTPSPRATQCRATLTYGSTALRSPQQAHCIARLGLADPEVGGPAGTLISMRDGRCRHMEVRDDARTAGRDCSGRRAGPNEEASFTDPITVDDVLAGPMIGQKLQCCIRSDGGGRGAGGRGPGPDLARPPVGAGHRGARLPRVHEPVARLHHRPGRGRRRARVRPRG